MWCRFLQVESRELAENGDEKKKSPLIRVVRVSADARGGEEQAGGARHDMRRRVTPIYDDASRRASVGSKQVKV